jgi:hypothetical protein
MGCTTRKRWWNLQYCGFNTFWRVSHFQTMMYIGATQIVHSCRIQLASQIYVTRERSFNSAKYILILAWSLWKATKLAEKTSWEVLIKFLAKLFGSFHIVPNRLRFFSYCAFPPEDDRMTETCNGRENKIEPLKNFVCYGGNPLPLT